MCHHTLPLFFLHSLFLPLSHTAFFALQRGNQKAEKIQIEGKKEKERVSDKAGEIKGRELERK